MLTSTSRTEAVRRINTVAWPIQPGPIGSTRPASLVSALVAEGLIAPNFTRWHHGKKPSTPSSNRAKVLRRESRLAASGKSVAILSPVFRVPTEPYAAWVDYYDDWAIAPDIALPNRMLALRAYQRVLSGRVTCPVTVNSCYMAKKLGLPPSAVVPNGTHPELSLLAPAGDDKRRLLILGHFFAGRTDYQFFKQIATSGAFEEVIVGGAGRDRSTHAVLRAICATGTIKVQSHDWLTPESICALSGSRTVAVIPHVVSDYTLSQDLMKIYQLLAMGLPIICPAPLWPANVDRSYAFLSGPGADVSADNIVEWIEAGRPNRDWRVDFVQTHSWRSRAKSLAEKVFQWTS